MKDRIRIIREARKETQEQFAALIKKSAATVSQYELGGRVPPPSSIDAICEKCHVNHEWLLTGEGPMYEEKTPTNELNELFGTAMIDNDPYLKAFITVLLKSNHEKRQMLYELFQDVVEETKRFQSEPPEG